MEQATSGPNRLAAQCEEAIADLLEQKARVPRSERRPINQRLHHLRGVLAWCQTRAGYVGMSPPPPRFD